MIVVIDNYDSFVYNLVQYLGELGANPVVFRNDDLGLADIERLSPSHIVVSPGPCSPDEAGVSNEVIRAFGGRIPLLGVCLGHQCIGAVYGGKVVRALNPTHGKSSLIHHDGTRLYHRLPNPFAGGRYHSLAVELPPGEGPLAVTARTEQGEIMGIRHRFFSVEGVQFHPESIMTDVGHRLLRNFLSWKGGFWEEE
jgi:anthranilate synthase component 2/para-aminobenzoate synthetase component 2